MPIQKGLDEEEVVLGQVVMADFVRAQVLDRLVVYERRIENSLHRTMVEFRQERQARMAVKGQASRPRRIGIPARRDAGTPAAKTELGSFGADVKRTPCGVTTNGDHGRDARATREPGELGSFGREADRGTGASQVERSHGRDAHATRPAGGEDHLSKIPSFHGSRPAPDAPVEGRVRQTNPIPGGRRDAGGTD